MCDVGHYVIDMNPIYFERIFAYLLTGDLSYKGLHREEIGELNHVLDYLLLPLPEPAPRWDPKFCGDGITLDADHRHASKTSFPGRYNGVQSAQPCSRFSVEVVQGQVFMIGFAPRHGFRKNTDNFNSCGWFLYVASGTLWSQDPIYNKVYDNRTAIRVGSVVTAIHDTNQHTIEFRIDGKSLGIAFSNVPSNETLFAAADFWGRVEIRIVD